MLVNLDGPMLDVLTEGVHVDERAPACTIVAGRRRWWVWRGPERALGAALASGPDGAGDLATRAVGCPFRGGGGKSREDWDESY